MSISGTLFFYIKNRGRTKENKAQDIVVNICKTKKLTNMRSSTADVMVTLQAHKELSLEECLEYIGDDELVEITPQSIRMRKQDLVKFHSI